jgi:peptidoglycan/xylan/chitin deacetylase (PgdA/CDA1 family)
VSVILLYHDVVEHEARDLSGIPGPLAARYKLTPASFERHLDAVAATGISVDLLEPGQPPPAAAFSFDDGGSSALTAAEALERRDWRGHFFVATSFVGRDGFLDRDGVRSLAARGHVVGSHSHLHPTYMGRLDRGEIDREWSESRQRLAEILGELPLLASVPGGFVSPDVIEGARRAGYRFLLTSEPSTRPVEHGTLLVVGRFAVWSTTPAARAAAYVTESRTAAARLWLEWNAKGIAKRITPRAYQALRYVRARRA